MGDFFLLMLWHDLDPVAVRICDEVNSHCRVFVADAAHFFMFSVDSLIVIYMKSQVKFTFTQIVRPQRMRKIYYSAYYRRLYSAR